MSLFAWPGSRCVKLGVLWTRRMGFVIVFTRRSLMTGFCLVTAVSNMTGGKQHDSLYPSFSVTSCSLCAAHHTHTYREKKTNKASTVLCNGSLFSKRVHLKDQVYQSTPWGSELDRRNIHWVSPIIFRTGRKRKT